MCVYNTKIVFQLILFINICKNYCEYVNVCLCTVTLVWSARKHKQVLRVQYNTSMYIIIMYDVTSTVSVCVYTRVIYKEINISK